MTNESLNTRLAIVPYVSEIEHEHIQEPIVGMTFNSYEEVCQFYKEYGKQKGFGIVIKHSNRRSDGRCRRLVLCCYKAGKAPDESARPSSKTNCQAKIITRLLADGMLHLMEADNEHNHEMNPMQACSGMYREKVGTSGGRKRRKVNSVVENVNGHRENVGTSSGMKRRNVNNVVGNVNGHKDENLSKIVINGREMTPIVKVAAICGSLHKASSNLGLLELAIQLSKESVCGLLIEYVDIASLPLLNTDLEVNGTYPPSVELFRQKILEADSILFASPECNYSLTGPLKNAIDWGSRPPNVWAQKTAAIISSGGDFGGGRPHYHLQQVGISLDLHFINKPELFVKAFDPPVKFNVNGTLFDPETKERLKHVLLSLHDFTSRLHNQIRTV